MFRTTLSLLFLFLILPAIVTAQESFSKAVAGKTIEFTEIDNLTIVGVAGNEMMISGPQKKSSEENDRSRGLRKISATGLRDNTGYGLSVTEEGGVIKVSQVGGENHRLKISIPNSATVRVKHSGISGGELSVSDFGGELDADLGYQSAELSGLTGTVAVNSIYGSIDAKFSKAPTKEVRLLSSYSAVDVSLPASIKADVSLTTNYGDMYTDFDINVKANSGKSSWGSGGKLNGTINGGGSKLSLTATYGDIYLRKQ